VSVLIVNSKVKKEKVGEVEAAVRRVFDALDAEGPGNVRYASCKGDDGVTFVVLLEIADGTDNPLPAIPAFRDFQTGLANWVEGPPAPEQLTVVGSYRLFD
jgi:hypothetical protein